MAYPPERETGNCRSWSRLFPIQRIVRVPTVQDLWQHSRNFQPKQVERFGCRVNCRAGIKDPRNLRKSTDGESKPAWWISSKLPNRHSGPTVAPPLRTARLRLTEQTLGQRPGPGRQALRFRAVHSALRKVRAEIVAIEKFGREVQVGALHFDRPGPGASGRWPGDRRSPPVRISIRAGSVAASCRGQAV